MKKLFVCALLGTLLAAVACMSLRASAGETGGDVLKRVEALEKQVKDLKDELAEGKRTLWSMDGGNLRVKIGGQYRIMGSASNFDWHAGSVSADEDGRTFFNQRFRTWFDVETSENVSAHLQVEIGHIIWGEDYEFTKNYAVGGDETGSELRRGYIVYKRDDLGTFRVGIQDWSDAFGGVLASGDWDFNVGGLAYSHKLEELWNTEIKVGAFMLWEGDTATAADDTTLFTLDLAWPSSSWTSAAD